MKDLLDNFDASATKPVTKKSNLVHKKPVFKQNVMSSSALQSLGDINQKTENHVKLEDTQPDTQMDEFDDFDDDFDDDAADLEEMARRAENLMLKDKAPLVKKKKLEPFHVYKKAEPRPDLQNWEAAEAKFIGSTDDVVKEDIKMDTEIAQEEGSAIRMWWYDAYEMRDKGTVYLFGKVAEANTNRYVSCCIIIHNIQRNLYFLPRQYELDGKKKEWRWIFLPLTNPPFYLRNRKWRCYGPNCHHGKCRGGGQFILFYKENQKRHF
jgi:DNA polymerase alpha subunit A